MAAAAKSNTNWFAVGISIAVVVILVALGALVVFLNNQAGSPGATPESSDTFNAESGAIAFGDGEDTVAVFADFHCPACKNFEEQMGPALEQAAEAGTITLEYHPIAILDHHAPGQEYSSRSAGAAVCVAESAPDAYLDFSKALFANQPQGSDVLSNEQLVELANQAGAEDAAACITDETYKKFGRSQADAHEIRSTPTVEINGERLDLQNDADFKRLTDLIS